MRAATEPLQSLQRDLQDPVENLPASLPANIESATDLFYYNQGFADGESDARTRLSPGDRRYFQGAIAFHEEQLARWLGDRWAKLPDRDKAATYTRGWLAAVSRP